MTGGAIRGRLWSSCLVSLVLIGATATGAGAELIVAHSNDHENTENGTFLNGSAPVVRVGVGSEPFGDGRNAIFSFQLPDLGSVSDPFASAVLDLNLESVTTVDGFSFNVDLYALPPRPGFDSPVGGTSVYYESDVVDPGPGITLIQTDFITGGSTATPGHYVTDAAGSNTLLDYLNAQYAGGVGAGEYVFFRLNPDADNGTVVESYNLTSSDGTSSADWPRIRFTMGPVAVQMATWEDVKSLYRAR